LHIFQGPARIFWVVQEGIRDTRFHLSCLWLVEEFDYSFSLVYVILLFGSHLGNSLSENSYQGWVCILLNLPNLIAVESS